METTTNQLGRTMPAAINVEAAVLSAMIIDESGPLEAMPLLKASDMFYDPAHRMIFEAISALYNSNEAIDMLTIIDKLKSQNKLEAVGGEFALIQLAQIAGSAGHIDHHCRILMQQWLKRKLIFKANEILVKAFQEDSDSLDLLEYDARLNDELSELLYKGNKSMTYAEALAAVKKKVELLSSQDEGQFTGVETGFAKVNKFTGGWQESDLVILAARPAMGKTAFILKNAVACGLENIPVGFFSLEMSAVQLAARTVAINSDLHLSMIIKDGFKKPQYFTTLLEKEHEMAKFPLYIDDTPSQDIRDIIAKARIWKRKHGIKILFIDYLQLVTDRTKSNNREQEIASIARNLKMLAKELSVPVIALSQLSRQVEARVDKRPRLSDLRESGAIEQDADIVAFLYREHYYAPDAILPDWLSEAGGNAELSFAKHRQGALETKGLYFDANKVKYMDPAERDGNESDEDWISENTTALPKLDPDTDQPF
jgi:replicative DNA helicase